ncbi:unnamed protein product [Durusdinium trenchii]|uniref:FIST C-domain domain-containing protein n=1 Tax=Durusdinium trenchii TaxID=1381693 RepID=A0ABP0LAQ3_9DINO
MPVRPPHPVPEPLQERVDALSAGVKALFTQKGIPYWVMAQMAQAGYTTMEDLADRWDTPALARQHAARDLNFAGNDHGWTNELRELISMRMFQCVRLAKETIGETITGLGRGPDQPLLPMGKTTGLDAVCDRKQILVDWDRIANQPRPKLTYQGSDNFLKKQFKLPLFDGWEREVEEEERAFPSTKEQIKKMHMVFRNNLYMCLISFPQHLQFNVTKVPWALPMPPTQRALTQWTGSASDAWAELQQWMQFVPQRLHEHLPPQTSAHLLLYAGKDDATSLDSCTRKLFPDLSTELIALDIRARRRLPAPWNFLERPVDPKDTGTAPSALRLRLRYVPGAANLTSAGGWVVFKSILGLPTHLNLVLETKINVTRKEESYEEGSAVEAEADLAAREVAERLATSCESPSLLLFLAKGYGPRSTSVGPLLQERFKDTIIVGCNSEGGVIATGVEHQQETFALAALALKSAGLSAYPFCGDLSELPPLRRGGKWSSMEDRAALAFSSLPSPGGDPQGWVYMLDMMLKSRSGRPPTVVGGMPVGGHAFVDGDLQVSGAFGVLLEGLECSPVVCQGAEPFGPFLEITAVRADHIISEINGQNPRQLLMPLMHGPQVPGHGHSMAGVFVDPKPDEPHGSWTDAHLAAAALGGRPNCLVRPMHSFTPEGHLVLSPLTEMTPYTPGIQLQLQCFSPEHALADLRSRAETDMALHGRPPDAAVIISCGARGRELYGQEGVESAIFREVWGCDVPTVGFFAGGEFGPVGLRTAFSGDNFVFDVGNWETADLARQAALTGEIWTQRPKSVAKEAARVGRAGTGPIHLGGSSEEDLCAQKFLFSCARERDVARPFLVPEVPESSCALHGKTPRAKRMGNRPDEGGMGSVLRIGRVSSPFLAEFGSDPSGCTESSMFCGAKKPRQPRRSPVPTLSPAAFLQHERLLTGLLIFELVVEIAYISLLCHASRHSIHEVALAYEVIPLESLWSLSEGLDNRDQVLGAAGCSDGLFEALLLRGLLRRQQAQATALWMVFQRGIGWNYHPGALLLHEQVQHLCLLPPSILLCLRQVLEKRPPTDCITTA